MAYLYNLNLLHLDFKSGKKNKIERIKNNMEFKDYTWDKEFEIKGYFSEIPEDIVNEHDSLSGILHYSPSEIVLELFGAFEVESGISFGFGKYLEKIYGS